MNHFAVTVIMHGTKDRLEPVKWALKIIHVEYSLSKESKNTKEKKEEKKCIHHFKEDDVQKDSH